MDGSRFDELSRLLAGAASRRAALKAALGGLLAVSVAPAALARDADGDGDAASAFPPFPLGGGVGAAKKRKKKACKPACSAGYACVKGACACKSGILCAGVCCAAGSACSAEGVCSLGPEPGCWAAEGTFGSGPGPGAGQLYYPYGLSVTDDGLTAYVSDSGNNRITIWTRSATDRQDWEQTGSFGSRGAALDQFRHPLGSALAADGLMLFVVDLDNQRVTVWTRPAADGQAWTAHSSFGRKGRRPDEFREPVTVAARLDGLEAWVTDVGTRKVAVWSRPDAASTQWTLKTLIGDPASATPIGVPVGVWVSAAADTLLVTDAEAGVVTMWQSPDAAGGAWTRTATFGAKGWGDGQFRTPWSIVGSADALTAWVCDAENDRIQVWNRPSEASTAWTWEGAFGVGGGDDPGQFYAPIGIALPFGEGAEREVLVADTGNNRISSWIRTCPTEA